MSVDTTVGVSMDTRVLSNYFHKLINSFFKILPLWECHEPTLPTYMRSLQIELIGCEKMFVATQYDSQLLSLISILQYFIDNPHCETSDIKREVFKAISICDKLKSKYSSEKAAM